MRKIIVECEDDEVIEIYELIKQITMKRNALDEPFVYIESKNEKYKNEIILDNL